MDADDEPAIAAFVEFVVDSWRTNPVAKADR